LPALNNGGVERGTVEMANFLAHKGHTSIVISAAGAMLDKLSDKVEHINLNIGKKSLVTLLMIKRLHKIFIHKKPDIVHARSRLPAWLALKAIAKIKLDKPKFITTVHGLYSVKTYSSIMARGDKVITVSQTATNYVKDNYSKYLKSEPCLIYRGIDTKEFPYNYQSDLSWLQNIYTKHSQLRNQKIVLLPGRLTALKGAKELIVWLKNSVNNAKLVLTADPENDTYTSKLNQWFIDHGVEKKITWIGLQTNMAELYALVDVVVNTSTRPESFGRTVAESLAVGTPVVAYDHGGVGEILSLLFPKGKVEINNQEQLSMTINNVLNDQPLVANSQPFVLSEMLQNTLDVYQDLLNEH
jgi:glycosyltransferase involved in cell wall biosynthesis